MYDRDRPVLSDNNPDVPLVDLYGEPEVSTTNDFAKWLYEDKYDLEKFKKVSILLHTPIVKDYVNFLLDYRADLEYMNRYDLDWSDIHDPRKLKSSGSYGSFVASGINFVSDNVKRLYK